MRRLTWITLAGVALASMAFGQEAEIRQLREAAESGDASAQYNLGVVYRSGEGLPEDDEQALNWFLRAAGQGHADAQYALGYMYRNGEGVQENDRVAIYWYRLAAKQGHTIAQFDLGLMYAAQEGVPRNDAEAVRWFRLAADQGHAAASYALGYAYANGLGVAQDDEESAKHYRLAAERGHTAPPPPRNPERPHSASEVSGAPGELVPQPPGAPALPPHEQITAEEIAQLAEGVPSVVDLAKMRRKLAAAAQLAATPHRDATSTDPYAPLFSGIEAGVGAFLEGRRARKYAEAVAERQAALNEALSRVRTSAGLAHVVAAFGAVPSEFQWRAEAIRQEEMGRQQLAVMREVSASSRAAAQPVDESLLAEQEFQQELELMREKARLALGLLKSSPDGAPGDDAEAVERYHMGAEQGNAAAQAALGFMYASGEGMPKDYVQAYVWLNLAAAQGWENTGAHRDSLSAGMTPQQVAEAQRLSRELHQRINARPR